MARQESDREDLMREATALRQRVELRVPGGPEPVVAGFHADGRLSLYFGPDPAYHFDPHGRLRRAFRAGDLYRAQGTTLARLRRERSGAATELRRHDLDSRELEQFLTDMCDRLRRLREALEADVVEVLRSVPGDTDLRQRLLISLPRAGSGSLAPALRS